jgi:2-isopropylmalate synthase
VRFFDTTLRDGEQTPGVHIRADRKVEIAGMLEAFGVATVEAGFPASSPFEWEAVRRVAATVRHCEVAALARCCVEDVEAAAEALRPARRSGAPVIHVFLGASDVHLEKKLRMTRAEALRAIAATVRHARRRVPNVQFSPEDATRAERVFLRQCVETAVAAGATRINIPDTVGCATPREYERLIRDIVAFVDGEVIVAAHCHDDMGLATANTVAAVEAGAGQVEVTINGIGERAGNAAAEQVAAVLALKGIAETGIDLSGALALSRRVAEVTGVPVQPNRPLVGAHAFAHSSGIHQDGLLKCTEVYEFVPPALVGAAGHRFVLTARSGRGVIAHKAANMGFQLDETTVDTAYRDFIEVAERTDGEVGDSELTAIIRRVAQPA